MKMGHSKSLPEPPEEDTYENESNELNGLIFADKYLPEEMLLQIFCFVDGTTLTESCCYVCQQWYNVVMKAWQAKCLYMYPQLHTFVCHNHLTVKMYYFMAQNKPFQRNLLHNASGEDAMKSWKVISNSGNGWKVESPPLGVQKPNPKITSCFVTSYGQDVKMQLIDLYEIGICSKILDLYQPEIIISEWYAPRWDCTSTYMLHVELLNVMKKCVDQFDFHVKLNQNNSVWKQVTHVFKNYGQAVRYVSFRHGGQDAQFWAGHYGSKMSQASVVVSLNNTRYIPPETMLPDIDDD